jgi:hypothetical protein
VRLGIRGAPNAALHGTAATKASSADKLELRSIWKSRTKWN